MPVDEMTVTVSLFSNVAFGYNCTAGFSDLGAIRWDLVGCYLPGWLFVMLALSRSLKLYARVSVLTPSAGLTPNTE